MKTTKDTIGLITHDSIRKTAKSRKQSFQQYVEAHDNLKKKKKAGNDNRSLDSVRPDTHCCQRPIQKATRDSTAVGIGRWKTRKSIEKPIEPYDEALNTNENTNETKDSNE